MGAKERKLSGLRKELPTIMVPLTEMMDYAIPKNVPHQIESFSQILIDTAPTEPAMGALPEVLIQKFENNYMVEFFCSKQCLIGPEIDDAAETIDDQITRRTNLSHYGKTIGRAAQRRQVHGRQ